jgi:ribulose-phosphate 3-epimerase
MMYNPDRYVTDFAAAGAHIITVHQEVLPNLHQTLQLIRKSGCKAGVTINPGTEVSLLAPVLEEVDLVLIMSVNPGFGGQKFLRLALEKLRWLKTWREQHTGNYLIEVDGGINKETIPRAVEAGADVLVAGEAIFGSDDPGRTCRELKKAAQEIRAENGRSEL